MTSRPPASTVPPFDHRDRGTSAADWRPLRDGLPAGAAVGGHDHLLVVAAHPDDETLGAGGLIADAATAGAQVTVVLATDGEGSHPQSPTHRPDELRTLRQQEVAQAVRALAPSATLMSLHRADGGLSEAVNDLTAAIASAVPDATVVAAPWRGDGHPDHAAAGEAAAAVAAAAGARLLEYPIWGWHWGRPGQSGPLRAGQWVRRPIGPKALEAKRAALAAHRSQHLPLSDDHGDEAILPPETLAHFLGSDEVFLAATAIDLPAGYFNRLYARSDDPWGIGTGFYEQRKRELLLASLPRPRFATAFEAGCSAGLLTTELAKRCDRLLAVDVSEAAVDQASQRTAQQPNVTVRRATLPDKWPVQQFDLIVISEMGYYLAQPTELAARAHASLTRDGVLVGCHWRHPAAGYPSSAEQVHAALGNGLAMLADHVEDDFLLQVWTTRSTSVARENGLVG